MEINVGIDNSEATKAVEEVITDYFGRGHHTDYTMDAYLVDEGSTHMCKIPKKVLFVYKYKEKNDVLVSVGDTPKIEIGSELGRNNILFRGTAVFCEKPILDKLESVANGLEILKYDSLRANHGGKN